MSIDKYLDYGASEPATYDSLVTITGTGASNPTKVCGRGCVVTWVSTGLYTITYTDNPGNLIGVGYGFQATTMSALKGYSITFGAMSASGKVIQFSVTNSAQALADLAALQTASLLLTFKQADIKI